MESRTAESSDGSDAPFDTTGIADSDSSDSETALTDASKELLSESSAEESAIARSSSRSNPLESCKTTQNSNISSIPGHYKCKHCPEVYTTRSRYDFHLRSVHQQILKVKCGDDGHVLVIHRDQISGKFVCKCRFTSVDSSRMHAHTKGCTLAIEHASKRYEKNIEQQTQLVLQRKVKQSVKRSRVDSYNLGSLVAPSDFVALIFMNQPTGLAYYQHLDMVVCLYCQCGVHIDNVVAHTRRRHPLRLNSQQLEMLLTKVGRDATFDMITARKRRTVYTNGTGELFTALPSIAIERGGKCDYCNYCERTESSLILHNSLRHAKHPTAWTACDVQRLFRSGNESLFYSVRPSTNTSDSDWLLKSLFPQLSRQALNALPLVSCKRLLITPNLPGKRSKHIIRPPAPTLSISSSTTKTASSDSQSPSNFSTLPVELPSFAHPLSTSVRRSLYTGRLKFASIVLPAPSTNTSRTRRSSTIAISLSTPHEIFSSASDDDNYQGDDVSASSDHDSSQSTDHTCDSDNDLTSNSTEKCIVDSTTVNRSSRALSISKLTDWTISETILMFGLSDQHKLALAEKNGRDDAWKNLAKWFPGRSQTAVRIHWYRLQKQYEHTRRNLETFDKRLFTPCNVRSNIELPDEQEIVTSQKRDSDTAFNSDSVVSEPMVSETVINEPVISEPKKTPEPEIPIPAVSIVATTNATTIRSIELSSQLKLLQQDMLQCVQDLHAQATQQRERTNDQLRQIVVLVKDLVYR